MSTGMEGLVSLGGKPVPLKEIDVHVTINGFVADIQSTSRYVNKEKSAIEAIFVFPVDDQCAVYKFETEIDGRRLIAECHDKKQELVICREKIERLHCTIRTNTFNNTKQDLRVLVAIAEHAGSKRFDRRAEQIYDDAVSYGHTAMLLEEDENAGDIFRCKLGNLGSKKKAKISMAFVTQLDFESDGKVKFTLPTILNPRYSPDASTLKSTEGVSYVPPNAIPYKFRFNMTVISPQKITGVHGPNDQLNVKYLEKQRAAKVSLAKEFTFDHDLTILVEYEACSVPQIIFEKGDPHSGGLLKEAVLMVNVLLEQPVDIPKMSPGEFNFIIDRSGSMAGNKMLHARETLLLFLKSLPVDCYFNIIGFGSSYECLFPEGSQKYNEENLNKAEELQSQMEANLGGTEILMPLKHIYSQKLIDNYPRQLFVLTDGEVSNVSDVVKLARDNSQKSRVFTVGIGHGASTALVRGLAKAGGGKEVFVADSERLQSKVISLLQCAMQPVATDVEIVWNVPSTVTVSMLPPKVPYIFLGERQILYLLLSGADAEDTSYVCSMTLKGTLISTPFEYKETFTLHAERETMTFAPIHRLAAKAYIKQLQLNEAPREEIILVSKSSNVISKHTAFVMVDKKGQRITEVPVKRVVPSLRQFRSISHVQTFSSYSHEECYDSILLCDSSETIRDGIHSAGREYSSSALRSAGSCIDYTTLRSKGSYADSTYVPSRYETLGISKIDDKANNGGLSMMGVIRLQTFQGSWNLDKKLMDLLEAEAESLKQNIPVQDDSVVATLAVIAWLRKHHSERRDEWQMLETKALAWLQGQDLQGYPVEELISKVVIMISQNLFNVTVTHL